jgi:four helix bundle protein
MTDVRCRWLVADEAGRGSMGFKRFEDLPAWQTAVELGVKVFELTASDALRRYSGLRDQIERAAVSVSNNIAEGFERGTHEELLTFLYYATGSAGEVRSMLCLVERLPGADDRQAEIQALRTLSVSVSRQLGAWIESLKNSQHKGPRYQNEDARRLSVNARRQKAFLAKLRRIVEEGRSGASSNDSDQTE